MRRGFTLIETLVVIGLMMTLAGVGYIAMAGIVRSQSLTNTTNVIVSQIVLAQTDAFSQTADTSHGVKVFSTEVVRFQGDSYDTRDESSDVTVPLPAAIGITGNDEVVFQKTHLAPDTPMNTTLSTNNKSFTLTVSPYGVVEIN